MPKVVNDPGWHILHPTDFSETSEVAFAHALKLALAVQGQLHVLHVSRQADGTEWRGFPGVREALERWRVLPDGSPPEAVGDLGIVVEKVQAAGDDPVLATHDFLRRHPADLIVLATHQHDGLARWREPSTAERIARDAHQVALFIPAGSTGFVDGATGALHLERILIPVDRIPEPQPALQAAIAMASLAPSTPVTFEMVHVGASEFPDVTTSDKPGWQWRRAMLFGEPATALIKTIHEFDPDLVVMATAGHHGFMDALRGSTTERVLRATRCPLLAVSIAGRLPQPKPR